MRGYAFTTQRSIQEKDSFAHACDQSYHLTNLLILSCPLAKGVIAWDLVRLINIYLSISNCTLALFFIGKLHLLLFPLAQYHLISHFWFRPKVSAEASSTYKVATVPLLKAFSVKVVVLTGIYKLGQDLVTYPVMNIERDYIVYKS